MNGVCYKFAKTSNKRFDSDPAYGQRVRKNIERLAIETRRLLILRRAGRCGVGGEGVGESDARYQATRGISPTDPSISGGPFSGEDPVGATWYGPAEVIRVASTYDIAY